MNDQERLRDVMVQLGNQAGYSDPFVQAIVRGMFAKDKEEQDWDTKENIK
jgi:hypothetical protein